MTWYINIYDMIYIYKIFFNLDFSVLEQITEQLLNKHSIHNKFLVLALD